jgi:SAM-dependent methyltransferase
MKAPGVDVHGHEMTEGPLYHEDLRYIAAEGFEIANRLCRDCGQLHALWPYIRLARGTSAGVEDASSRLQSVLIELIAGGRRDVLIAGSADAGLLAQVARSGAGHPLDIVVLDRCETPLEMCRRLAQRWSLPIATLHEDLFDLDHPGQFDIVLVHGTLHFLAPNRCADALTRIRRLLRPNGRLVLRVNTGRRIEGNLAEEGRDGYAHWVPDELSRIAVPLPEPPEAFRERLRLHARSREDREGVFAAPEDIQALLAQAGFVTREWLEMSVKLSEPIQEFVAKTGKRRFLVIAEPKGEG